jgi:hypothetical protein
MAQGRPPFHCDLNELPPLEEDGANHAASLDPACKPPPQQDPSPQPKDLSPPPSKREPSPQALPPPPSERAPSQHDLPPPPSVRETSSQDLLSLVLDLEAPLSPLDEDEDDAESQLSGPPSLPPAPESRGMASPVAPSRSSRSSAEGAPDKDTLGVPGPRRRHGERTPPRLSQETPPPRRAPSRGPSDTTSSHRSRYGRPYGDAICKRRRAGHGEDAASFYGRTPPSPRRHEKTSGRIAPATNGEFGGTRPKDRQRSRLQRPNGNRNYGQDQTMQQAHRGREKPQGFRGQERSPPPGHHQDYNGPLGDAMPIFSTQHGSSDHRRPRYGREDSYHRRQNQVQEPAKTGGYQHKKEAVSFSGAHRREGSYSRRQSPVQEPPKIGGYRQPRELSRAHGKDDFYVDRSNSAVQEPDPNFNGGYQQREDPRHRGHVQVRRPYHPYDRDAGAFDDRDNTRNQVRPEARPNNSYQHRRDDTRNKEWRRCS